MTRDERIDRAIICAKKAAFCEIRARKWIAWLAGTRKIWLQNAKSWEDGARGWLSGETI